MMNRRDVLPLLGLAAAGVAGNAIATGPNWINVPFNAANFNAFGAMGWRVYAGNIAKFKYQMSDPYTMDLVFLCNDTHAYGVPSNTLLLKIPGGKKILNGPQVCGRGEAWDSDKDSTCSICGQDNDTWLQITRNGFFAGGELWGVDPDCDIALGFTIRLEVADA